MPTKKRRNDKDEHPVLTPEQDKEQRGGDPAGAIGQSTPGDGALDPNWQPSNVGEHAKELIGEIGREHRPRREDVYPYLLIRAFSPGDRGARPTWPPRPCWESPDIALIDASYTGPFTPSRLVASPVSGRRYRVFVRIWNLGLLPAIGVHVRAWAVNPGFFGGDPSNPAYQPVPIGGAMVNLQDRTRPGAVAVVELDRTWDIPPTMTGHECLMASVSCPLDPWGGALDSNHDRHVGQRNLTILAGPASMKDMLFTLGSMLTKAGTLELRHGGAEVTTLLKATLGRTKGEFETASRRAPSAKAMRAGVSTGAGWHLLTMFATERGWLVADTAKVWAAALEFGLVERDRLQGRGRLTKNVATPFATPLATRAVIEKLGPEHAELIGVVIDADPGEALVEGIARLWRVDELTASQVARALAEGPGTHLLRFVHHDAERGEDGGYSLIIAG